MKPNMRKNVKQITKKYVMDMDTTKNVTVNQFTIAMKFPKRYNLKAGKSNMKTNNILFHKNKSIDLMALNIKI